MQLKKDEAGLIVDLITTSIAEGNELELGYYDLLKKIAYEFPEYENLCNSYIDDEQKNRQISNTDIDCL